MSIRKKTFAIIALTLLVATLVFSVITQVILLRQFEILEKQQVVDSVGAARDAILADASDIPLSAPSMPGADTLRRLENLLHGGISLHALGDPLPFSVESLVQAGALTTIRDSEYISGFAPLYDGSGAPIRIVELTTERKLYQQAQSALNVFILAIVLAGATAGTWFAVLLDRSILSRIMQLKSDINAIRSQQRLKERVGVRGRDELADLGIAINDLISSLEIAQSALTQARDEALQSLESKNQLLANISHDARTPLSVIMLRAENMERGVYGPLTTRQREVLAGMKASANQMLFFVNNLLASAKLKTGMMQLASDPIDVAMLIANVRTLMEPLAAESGLELVTDAQTDADFTPYGDADRIKQIVFNLLDNAIKFTDSGGTITLRFSNSAHSHWDISVQDTGHGIPDHEKRHIFDAFYQVDPASTRAAVAGVGLGLSIVRQLTTLMNGKIELQSELGAGTTFTISLPSRAPRVETQEMATTQ